ncbi:MAG: hypothetical protein R3E76_00685 [Planctomycetota bacterium]
MFDYVAMQGGTQFREHGKLPDGGLDAIVGGTFRYGKWTTPEDFEVEYPEPGESTMKIVYSPNKNLGLTDPRNRVAVIDLAQGRVVEWEDRYPAIYGWVLAGFLLLVIAGWSALVFWAGKLRKRSEELKQELDWAEHRRRVEATRRLKNTGID